MRQYPRIVGTIDVLFGGSSNKCDENCENTVTYEKTPNMIKDRGKKPDFHSKVDIVAKAGRI